MTAYRLVAVTWLALACDDEGFDFERMLDQHKYEAYERSSAFADGMVMRTPPEGTIARESVLGPPELLDGARDGVDVERLPVPLTRELLVRGQERFRIFCATCHGELGDGRSQVAENMTLRPPPSLHEPRLRAYPPGRLFRVVSRGYGLMPSYAPELSLADRWAVVAYVQALQLSQSVELARLPPDSRKEAEPWLR